MDKEAKLSVLNIPNEEARREIQRAMRDFMDTIAVVGQQEGETILGIAATEQYEACMRINRTLIAISNEAEMPLPIDNEEERELLIRALQNRRAKLLHQATIVMVGRTAHAARASAYLVEQALGLLGAPLDCEHPDHLKDEEPVQLTTEARRLLGMSESEGNMGT
jgi:hypothetical protein